MMVITMSRGYDHGNDEDNDKENGNDSANDDDYEHCESNGKANQTEVSM